MVVVFYRSVIILVENAQLDQFPDALVGQIGVDRPRAEAEQGRDLVHVPGFAALQDQGYGCALFSQHQVLLYA